MFETRRSQCLRIGALTGESSLDKETSPTSAKSECLLPHWLQQQFMYAGIGQPSIVSLSTALALQLILAVSFLFYDWLPGILAAVLPGLVGYACLFRLSQRRAERFEQDYTAFLLSLSSSIRTGLDPLVAFSRCSSLFSPDSVVSLEIKKTALEVEAGAEEECAFLGFARSVNQPDIGLLRTALVLSRRQGSSLGACLQRLAKVTRQRQSFRRKMRGAVAMQRLSAFGIAGCTGIVGLIQFTSNPQAVRQAWDHSVGRLALGGGIALVVFGLLWMLHLSRRRQ